MPAARNGFPALERVPNALNILSRHSWSSHTFDFTQTTGRCELIMLSTYAVGIGRGGSRLKVPSKRTLNCYNWFTTLKLQNTKLFLSRIWTRNLPNMSLVRYHGATSFCNNIDFLIYKDIFVELNYYLSHLRYFVARETKQMKTMRSLAQLKLSSFLFHLSLHTTFYVSSEW